jgi:formamidopyrimidine-DNA glycosylase
MPELPEVETIARGLAAALVGSTVADVSHAREDYVRSPPPGVRELLRGRKVVAVTRHGKQLTVHLGGGVRVLVHLGMSGTLRLCDRALPREPHTHLVLSLRERPEELRLHDPRRFGGAWIRADGAADGSAPSPLGPDALSLGWPAFRALLGRPRQIKALLLDQRAVAGLGNIYVDEALWAAGIHPLRRADTIDADRARLLHRALRRILRSAIRHGGSTLRDYRDSAGKAGRFQSRHRVYGREGLPCARCGTTIVRRWMAGRSSHVCPHCQRAPRRRRRNASGRAARPAASAGTRLRPAPESRAPRPSGPSIPPPRRRPRSPSSR